MYVREYMTSKVITVEPEALVIDAQKLMRDSGIRRLPVVDKKGKLVGIVTQDRLREVSPSPATSLSRFELEYLIAKMKVKDVMVKKVITVTPDTPVEEAARIGQERRVGALPVIQGDRVVGIITTTDLFNVMTRAMGFGQPGTRLHLHSCGRGDPLLFRVLDHLRQRGLGIRAMFAVTPPGHGEEDTVIHLDKSAVAGLVEELRGLGCQVESRPH